MDNKNKSKPKTPAKKTQSRAKTKKEEPGATPLMATSAAVSANSSGATRSRRNAASSIVKTDRYKNIEDGMVPFRYGANSASNSDIDVRDAVILCQKAYYNFSIFRNTIDLMAEFCVSNIYFKGGSKKSRDFFNALFKKINLRSFQDKFFREYFRSGNVFVFRFDGKLKKSDINKLARTFGANASLEDIAAADSTIPLRYIILNPADIKLSGSLSFVQGEYKKSVSTYELDRLRDPKTEEEKELVSNLPDDAKKAINNPRASTILLPLEKDKIVAVFYKKQDYEPFAVPMGYPVLEDINAKYEMKKIDMAIARTMQQAILLVTMGAEPEKGGINQKNLEAMQNLFANESVGRVLIADYTTKAEFVVPSIGALLDPAKYTILDQDIRIGLNNILIGENEKFANQSIKVKVFTERLKQARETFINDFLYPEIKRISRALGFKNFPTAHFDNIDLRDNLQYSRIYTRLVELGILTAEEGLQAIEHGRLPSQEEALESQEEFRSLKDKGLYEPLLGGPFTQKKMADKQIAQQKKAAKENGRPEGTGTPQQSKNVSPIGEGEQSKAVDHFSLEHVKNNLILAQKLQGEVEKYLREKHDIKRLNKKQKSVAEDISEVIICNEPPENWNESVAKYTDMPIDHNSDRVNEVMELSHEHGVNAYLASILLASKKEKE
tara:strand:- start:9553 stop:11556 length:2004 start_codon:yes stop_codon:yes gene_type:complete